MTVQPARAPQGGRLERLVRYPVKGFGGQELPSASVQPGGGLPYDRMLAVASGDRTVEPDGSWTACQAFVRLTKNSDLPLYATDFSGALGHGGRDRDEPTSLCLTSPTGESVRVGLDGAEVASADRPAADSALGGWFRPGPLGPARLVASRHGLWDHSDAVLSLINLETVADLARTAGRPVDPLRFRANLYLSGLPAWSELALVGRRIRLGEVELEVLRPTDRCRATAVDPRTGATDLNVPALLAATYGHLYCGVYARVVTGGRLSPGQRCVGVGTAAEAVRDATTVGTAPPTTQWPRPATVADRVSDSETVNSLWLRDPLAELRPAPLPGQHLRVHAVDEYGPLWRSYTISAVEGDRLRISVKDAGPDGRMSRLLRRTGKPGNRMLISGPFGDMTLETAGTGPVLLASAGIGITPMVAMLRALAEHRNHRPVIFWHVARTRDDLALWAEARAIIAQLPAGQARLFLTRTPNGTVGADDDLFAAADEATIGRPRRPQVAALLDDLGVTEASIYLCGPAGFLVDLRAAAINRGVPPAAIHSEVFVSPRSTAGQATPPPLPGPFRVRFTGDLDVDAVWRRQDGSLLDAAEAAGLSLPAGCRSGACGTCAQPVTAGSTAYLTEPVLAPPHPAVLLCCAAPTSDVTIGKSPDPLGP